MRSTHFSFAHCYERLSANKSSRKFNIIRVCKIKVSFFVSKNLGRKGEPVHSSRRYKEWLAENVDDNALSAHFSSSATFRFDISL